MLILKLEKCTSIHLRILMHLYIQPTDFKCSSVEWIISDLGVLMMPQGTFLQSILCENMLLLSYFDAVKLINGLMDGVVLLFILKGEINPAETKLKNLEKYHFCYCEQVTISINLSTNSWFQGKLSEMNLT